jgi:hypothetical protein
MTIWKSLFTRNRSQSIEGILGERRTLQRSTGSRVRAGAFALLGRWPGLLTLLVIVALAVSGCGALFGEGQVNSPPTPMAPSEPGVDYAHCPQRALIMSIDGLRPDALSPEAAPNIYALATQGAYTWTARTINPPSTLPGHASMLTGYDVLQHRISWNDYYPEMGYVKTTSLFEIAHDHGLRTSMFVGKDKMRHIVIPGSVDDFVLVPGTSYSDRVLAAIEYFEPGFGVMFVHMGGMDKAGHTYGWMSDEYLAKVPEVDDDVGVLMDALRQRGLEETTLVILTADHGGLGKDHKSSHASVMNIPWIIAGPGVNAGLGLTTKVRIYDTTATVLWALGLPIPEDMAGTPVREAFGASVEAECSLMELQSAVPFHSLELASSSTRSP